MTFRKIKLWFVRKVLYRKTFRAVEVMCQAQCGNSVCPSCINKLDPFAEFPNQTVVVMKPGETEVEYDCPHCGVRLNERNLKITLKQG